MRCWTAYAPTGSTSECVVMYLVRTETARHPSPAFGRDSQCGPIQWINKSRTCRADGGQSGLNPGFSAETRSLNSRFETLVGGSLVSVRLDSQGSSGIMSSQLSHIRAWPRSRFMRRHGHRTQQVGKTRSLRCGRRKSCWTTDASVLDEAAAATAALLRARLLVLPVPIFFFPCTYLWFFFLPFSVGLFAPCSELESLRPALITRSEHPHQLFTAHMPG